ncbi:MAG: hypothetical protein HY549_08870 [Elusimicrobia bacterium]|nr:hypothetical protein [Elusimicrobiota bacterium]
MPAFLAAALLCVFTSFAFAANLDVSASYRMRALSYHNLNLNPLARNNHAFLANDARLGIAVRRIGLEKLGAGSDTTMDVGLLLHAVGVAGSSSTLESQPFDRIARHYPSSDLTPFIENAYLRVNRPWSYPVRGTFGRQNYRLASGLLLDDDGAGLTGIVLSGELPWWGLRAEGFVFSDRDARFSAPNALELFGLTVDLPTEGTWQLSQLFERDRALQPVFGCSYVLPGETTRRECLVSKIVKSFSSLRYQIHYGPMVFDGEAALQRGSAVPTGPSPAPNHITYQGDAQVIRAKWKQRLYKTGEGIARLSLARGSGDDPATATRDEAFFPARGHRFQGLERNGFGEFFAATPYDAFGGNYSTSSASGLRDGASGIIVVGGGYTPPAYKGFVFDIDYFLFQAERIRQGSRTLGMEWDFRIRYALQDQFTISATAALFKAGTASNPTRGSSKKYALEVSGRF